MEKQYVTFGLHLFMYWFLDKRRKHETAEDIIIFNPIRSTAYRRCATILSPINDLYNWNAFSEIKIIFGDFAFEWIGTKNKKYFFRRPHEFTKQRKGISIIECLEQ
jgi:hypothetical protein